jgi:cellulose synthase/poly-beta-1,6-N-acetylglucosamine synthase-like glycosyltransferase
MLEHFFNQAFVAVYVFILLAVALYGIHRYMLVYLYLKHRNNAYIPKEGFAQLPRITVQLPMYNEDVVAERIIKASCQIDYPLELLDIQVLDDSTDDSADIARRACQEWAAKGYPISYIHRDNRVGYKAGALAAGSMVARGEFIAIFDADFVPPRDILRNVVNYFSDPKVGMVQVRWDHLNRDASLLTKSQAIFLDGHFVIEHTARNRSGRFMHFNGTAGVWRRSTIEDAGGWQHDTLTEDLDLSYRAQLKGWQFVYLPQFCAPAELPPEMLAFKQQAHRWTKGSMQTAIKLLPRILRSRHLGYRIKTEAFFHLTCTIVYPMMVLLTIMMYPAFIYVDGPLKNWPFAKVLFSVSLFVLATCSASTFFVFAQRELFGKQATWKSILALPMLMALGVGICINNTKAVFEAIWGAIHRKPSEFVRTPKYGVSGKTRNDWKHREDPLISMQRDAVARTEVAAPSFLTLKRMGLPIIEIAFGAYMSSFIFISLWYHYARGSVPFLMIFAGGYFYVGVSSLYVLWKMQQEADQTVVEPEEALA